MSKTGKPTNATEAKKKTGSKEPSGKPKEKNLAAPAKKTPAKGAPEKVKAPDQDKKTKKPAETPTQDAGKTQQKASTARIEKLAHNPPPAAPASHARPIGFGNAGLGVKTASKKPGLSIAPGVMILGKPTVEKTETGNKTSERRLSKKELSDIKTLLLEKRERLLAGMRRELAVQRERAESKAADEVDKATDAYDEDLSFEIATANDQELGEIQVALEKIDKGTYGECEICGCTISPSRLKILPSATTCVSCRGQEEQARRRDDSNILFSMMSGEDEVESGDM